MAVCYFVLTIVIIFRNIGSLPQVFERIFQEAFGFRQIAAGGFGAVLMNGIKRGLFSNEAGSGSAPVRQRQQNVKIRFRQDWFRRWESLLILLSSVAVQR